MHASQKTLDWTLQRRVRHGAGGGLGLGLVFLAGCAGPLDRQGFDPWVDQDFTEATLRADPSAAETGSASGGESELPADAGPEDYVAAVLRRNPRVVAAQREVQRMAARVPQARALDDPRLSVSPVGEMAETAAGQVGLMAGVSQTLPLPAKLEAREKIAAQGIEVARAKLMQTRLEVAAQTRQAYAMYYAADRLLGVTRRSGVLLEQLTQAAEAQYRSGIAEQQDVLRATLERAAVDEQLNTLAAERAGAQARLNRLLGRPTIEVLPEPIALVVTDLGTDLAALLVAAARQNPAAAGLHRQVERERQRLRLAELSRWPDLTVGLNYAAVDDEGIAVRANGKDQWYLSFGITLPIWPEKYDAAEREAFRGLQQSIAELRAVNDEVAYRVRDAYERVRANRANVELLRGTVLPQAEQTVDAALSGYRGGGGDFTSLIESWRRQLQFEQMLYRNQAMWQQAMADLQQAVGSPGPLNPPNPAVESAGPEPTAKPKPQP